MHPMRTRVTVVSFSLFAIVLLAWLSNRGYGEMSERGYEFSMSLFSACNRQDLPRVEKIETLVNQARSSGELQSAEARWIEGIIVAAKQGKWEKASRSVRELMESQIKPTNNLPKLE